MNIINNSFRKFFRRSKDKQIKIGLFNVLRHSICSVVNLDVTVLNQIKEVNDSLNDDISALKTNDADSILSPCTEDVSDIAPYFPPSFNLAAYVNKSDTLKKLVQLGVNLHKIEKKPYLAKFILKLDFEKDMKHHIFFLHNLGVGVEEMGNYITKNPLIFQEDLENLQVRINYLEYKKFKSEMITRIITKNPYWLMFSTKNIDERLGYFQHTFKLTGNQVRSLATKQPRLITYKMSHLKLNTFSVQKEMGFTDEQMSVLLIQLPNYWMMNQQSILNRFDYVHNTMRISHEQILHMPKILLCRKQRTEERHKFLQFLGRAQYNPRNENYVSLDKLVEGTDSEFCVNVAKSSVQTFNTFLKSL